MFKIILSILIPICISQLSFATEVIEEPIVIIEEEAPVFVDAGVILEAGKPPVYNEEQLEKARLSFGVTKLDSSGKPFKAYTYRDQGTFIISNENFSNANDAQSFCDSASNVNNGTELSYELIDSSFAFAMAFLGLPFPSLLDNSYIYKPVLDHEGLRTGVIFWATGYADDSADEKTAELLAFTDGNGAGASNHQVLSSLNMRLNKEGLKSVAMPVVCFDESLKKFLED